MSSLASLIGNPVAAIVNAFTSLSGKPSAAAVSGNNSLIATLKEMESAYAKRTQISMPDYSEMLPETTGANKITYETKTPEELEAEAMAALLPSYQEKLNSLEESTAKKLNTLTDKIEKSENNVAVKTEKLDDTYTSDVFDAEKSLVKRNMLHSSVKEEEEEALLLGYVKGLEALRAEYGQLMEGYEREISVVQESKTNALLQYDLKLAADLEKKIASLKTAEEKAIKEINTYNQKLAEAESLYQAQRTEAIKSLQADWYEMQAAQKAKEEIYGYVGEKKTEMDTRYQLAKEFYASLGAKEAKNLIEENAAILKEVLGVNYYTKLRNEIK